jgi:hypothetical protein
MLAEELKASDVGLEFLTGELKGSHDPSGIVFTVDSVRNPKPSWICSASVLVRKLLIALARSYARESKAFASFTIS